VKKKPTSAEDKGIAAVDDFLAAGGFRHAKRPQGALARERVKRDARKKSSSASRPEKPLEVLQAGWHQPWLRHGFSTRTGGYSTIFGGHDLNLGMQKHDDRRAVEKNRKTFFAAIGAASGFRLVTLKQVHSSHIHILDRGLGSKTLLVGDGAITNRPGLLLSIQTADCVPVLLVDAKKKVVGAFHAGWRGTAKRIVEKGVGMMRMTYGTDPSDIHAAIGPCIQQCCYAVGPEVVDEFHSQFFYAALLFKDIFDDDPLKTKYPLLFMTARAPGHGPVGKQPHLDLTEANQRQLLDAGVLAANIWTSELCTSCNTDRLFSHRKEDGFTGRMMAVVGVKHGK
jgi:polyphenol oxidase